MASPSRVQSPSSSESFRDCHSEGWPCHWLYLLLPHQRSLLPACRGSPVSSFLNLIAATSSFLVGLCYLCFKNSFSHHIRAVSGENREIHWFTLLCFSAMFSVVNLFLLSLSQQDSCLGSNLSKSEFLSINPVLPTIIHHLFFLLHTVFSGVLWNMLLHLGCLQGLLLTFICLYFCYIKILPNQLTRQEFIFPTFFG